MIRNTFWLSVVLFSEACTVCLAFQLLFLSMCWLFLKTEFISLKSEVMTFHVKRISVLIPARETAQDAAAIFSSYIFISPRSCGVALVRRCFYN